MSLDLLIVRPAGNDTCLVFGKVDDPAQRKVVNDAVMRAYPNVEQVGFVYSENGSVCLQMAGGEFCGNATRSAAAALLSYKTGQMTLEVSGVSRPLQAGVTSAGDAFADMPVYADPALISADGPDGYIAGMEGITHYVLFTADDTSLLSDNVVKERAYRLLKEKGLLECPAAGVMYVTRNRGSWRIDPVVYVRDIDTLFRETACGSGTTALGLVLAVQKGGSIEVPVVQPSTMEIVVSVDFDGSTVRGARIKGPIRVLGGAMLEITPRFAYITERIYSDAVDTVLDTSGLRELYRKLFSRPPYSESFTDQEISDCFREYATQGILYVARVAGNVIGFGAALPMSSRPDISGILDRAGVNPVRSWYMADLGVDDAYRRSGVATVLVRRRLQDIPAGSVAVMRTSVRNDASRRLYGGLGFNEVEGAFQNVMQRRTDGSEVEDTRLFLAKQIL